MRKAFCLALLVALALPATAQRQRITVVDEMTGRNRFSWEYDADFQLIFDNREFAYSNDAFIPSGTMNTVVFAPTVGLSIRQTRQVHHRLAVGAELAYDLGSQTWANLVREPVLFYDAHVQTKRGVFEGLAGIFPRRYMEGAYSEAFFSGMYRNTDRYVEGVLLKWRGERFYTELACDWMGQYGRDRRERFQVISFGRWAAARWLSLGWTGSFYHYACSELAPEVIDNHLLQPWLKMDFSHRTAWQELSMQLGALVGYQFARARESHPSFPAGGEMKLTARRWNVGVSNVTYLGGNLIPHFFEHDPNGGIYGVNLYFGTPLYKDFYNYTEVAWIPQISHYFSLRLAAKFHFTGSGFMGWQHQFSLRFNLDAFRNRDTTLGRCL